MSSIDSRAAQKLQPELLSGETIYWAGTPNPGIIFHSDDLAAIPFALLWTGFWVFWEASALGIWSNNASSAHGHTFFILWGIPLLLIGQYIVWGRFFVDAWLKRRTYYAVTNRRLLILQEGWRHKTRFLFLESVPEISREGTRTGTLWLGPKYPVIAGRGKPTRAWSRYKVGDSVPVLADINDVDYVEGLIYELREKLRPASTQPQKHTYPRS